MNARLLPALVLALLMVGVVESKDCPPGFEWQANSGVGCVQMDCFDRGGHWSSTQHCICADGKKPCRCGVDYSNFDDGRCFPDCPLTRLVSCIDVNSECPPCEGESVGRGDEELTVGEPPPPDPQVESLPRGPLAARIEHLGGLYGATSNRPVMIKNEDGEWEVYKNRSPLYAGAHVLIPSYTRARVQLYGKDGTLLGGKDIYVGGRTEFLIPYPRDHRRARIPERENPWRLLKGFFLMRFKRLWEGEQPPTHYRSPGVIAGVRGTEFVFKTDPDEAIDHVMVREGEVFVEGEVRGAVLLTAGQQVIAHGGVVGEPQPLSDEDWAAAAAECGAAEAEPATTANRCESLVGRWRWFNGAMAECFPDGTCAASNGFDATWDCLQASGRFEIRWARPGQTVPYVDTVSLSADGWELEGVNQAGQGVGGRRPEFTGGDPASGCDALIGSWRWANGAAVQCSADGRCASSGGVSGPWRCINQSGRFEIRWGRGGQPDQFIDNVVVSPLGSYLAGKNQYGVATGATRE